MITFPTAGNPSPNGRPDRWPHLRVPGRGAHNQIAGTPAGAIARAKAGRQPEPPSRQAAARLVAAVRAYPELWRTVLLDLLADDMADIALAVAEEVTR